MQTKNVNEFSTRFALSPILIGSMLCAIGSSFYPMHLRAEPITFQFEGYVNLVSPSLAGVFTELQSFQGTYTFESTTPDSDGDANFGFYEALTGLEYSIGEYSGVLGSGLSYINVLNAHGSVFANDVYAINDLSPTGEAVAGLAPANFFLQLTDPTGTALASDALLLEPPRLADFNSAIWVLSFGNSGDDVVQGFVTDFTLSPDVTVDIKPGSDSNHLNLRSKGNIPVAVLTTEVFDATQIDVSTVVFAPGETGEVHDRAHIEDVDGDGDMDALFHFRIQDTGIACGDTEATLTGATFSGLAFAGSDTVGPKPCREPDVGHIWRVNYTQVALNSMNGKVETHVLATDSSFASSGANFWNEGHSLSTTQTLMETSTAGGGAPSITFVGQAASSTVTGNPMSGEPIDDDLDNWAGRFSDAVVTWELRDLNPLTSYDLVFYDLDSLTASITLTTELDSDGDGVLDQTDTIAWDVGDDFSLFQGVSPDAGGVIRGRWTGSSSSFVDVAGFQVAESTN